MTTMRQRRAAFNRRPARAKYKRRLAQWRRVERKIRLNANYGKLGAGTLSKLYSPEFLESVTLSAQLATLEVIERHELEFMDIEFVGDNVTSRIITGVK